MASSIPRGNQSGQARRPMIVQISQRWIFTLPKSMRQGLSPDQIFEVQRHEDAVIELRPRALMEQSQAWFWSERWQAMEREANEDIAAGRVKQFGTVNDLFEDLDASESE